MTQSDITSLMRVVSGCLLLGNVETTGADSGRLAEGGEDILKTVSELFACCYETLISALTVKITKAAGEEIKGPYREDELSVNIKSLAKAMYSQSFQWVMRKLNEQIKNPNPGEKFMGMLDIFGFEVFKNNSLEQLFINITNEYLQKNFVDVVFKRENELYKSEGVSLKDMTYTTNDQIIAVLIGKGGLMQALEDQCLGSGSDERFIAQAYSSCSANPKLKAAKIMPKSNFIVSHVVGDIQYNVTGFIEKNKDILRGELMEIMNASKDNVVNKLFEGLEIIKGGLPKGQLIGSQYLVQLNSMMKTINATECHFIR